jgi:hypothetical protein
MNSQGCHGAAGEAIFSAMTARVGLAVPADFAFVGNVPGKHKEVIKIDGMLRESGLR